MRDLMDYPLSAFVEGAQTVWGRLFMIYLALNLPAMLYGGLLYGVDLFIAGMGGALLAFVGGPVFLVIANFTTFWGLILNIAICLLALGYFVGETHQCERFFALAWLSLLGWTIHGDGIGGYTIAVALILAAIHGAIRGWAWHRLRQLDRMTLRPPEYSTSPADAPPVE